jgi:16S rRNA (uracil1498-N3)-methyltransferase
LRVMLSELPEAAPMREVLAGARAAEAALAIGPEGGWTEEEFAAAQRIGFREASLGKLILRAETAVVAGLAVMGFAVGE